MSEKKLEPIAPNEKYSPNHEIDPPREERKPVESPAISQAVGAAALNSAGIDKPK